MILEAKQTTVGYRCSRCGAGVMSAVGLFSLTADMIKLKCTCGGSEMTVQYGQDGKIRATVPCLLCGKPHRFNVSRSLFFGKDLFLLPCPYSDQNIAMTGTESDVKAELARGELELLDLMEKMGVLPEELDEIRKDESLISDPQIEEIVMYVINELDAEGKIDCKCDPSESDRQYDAEITEDGILVSCRKCGARRLIPTDSGLAAHAFLTADALHLE